MSLRAVNWKKSNKKHIKRREFSRNPSQRRSKPNQLLLKRKKPRRKIKKNLKRRIRKNQRRRIRKRLKNKKKSKKKL
jgi:hypothetical protein